MMGDSTGAKDLENRCQNTTSEGKPKTIYTTKECIDLGLKCSSAPPEPETCKFCKKPLYYQGIYIFGVVSFWSPAPIRCDCERAVDYWKRRDAEEARKKEELAAEEARRYKKARIDKLLGDSGIKKRFANRTFDNFRRDTPERERCYNIAKRYADNFESAYSKGDGLYFEGSNGTGKTHLAAAIALQLISVEVPVIFKTSLDLLGDLRRTFDNEISATEYEVTRIYKTVDLLIIDDLGKEQCTDWSISTLYNILNDRYEDMKPTIITTNYGVGDLVTAMTPKGYDSTKVRAIISRLRETSINVCMEWDDWRGRRE